MSVCALVFLLFTSLCLLGICFLSFFLLFFFFNDTATTEIYTRSIVGSVRCVQETGTWEIPEGEEIEDVPEKLQVLTALKRREKDSADHSDDEDDREYATNSYWIYKHK
eukprot:TRINITY_DN17861_c0_g1_i2.p1 TRINITY_DN17861_c0_g1~~TRINITY_DN17861_c0_g1_i2.p1  ORF type:complete len:109 (+),score=34.35 TRINITY_DN17861_c0_g1_i2:31-357(+)